MTIREWEIIEPRLDALLTELDLVLAAIDEEEAVRRVVRALTLHDRLTFHALLQYTRLTSPQLTCALSLSFDRETVGQRANGRIRFYYLKGNQDVSHAA